MSGSRCAALGGVIRDWPNPGSSPAVRTILLDARLRLPREGPIPPGHRSIRAADQTSNLVASSSRASASVREGELRYDVLPVSLAAAAGAVDVTSLLGLGQVFTANMSGNLVIFGLAIGGGAHADALHSLAALLGFVAGAALGARLRGPRRRGVSVSRSGLRARGRGPR